MKRAIFACLEDPERAAAVSVILRAGLEPNEFVLEERRTDHNFGGGASSVHKLISVKRSVTGAQRQYSTGRGGGWPFEFERDLRCGFYDHDWPAEPGISSGAPQ